MSEREGTKSSAFSAPSLSPNLESSARKKKRSSSASPPRRNNKIFNNIVTEQPRVQMKHYQLESLWRKLASEVGDETAGGRIDFHRQEIAIGSVCQMMHLGRGPVKAPAPTQEASLIMTRACELLILEITLKACVMAGHLGRDNIQKQDVTDVIESTEEYDIFNVMI